MVLKMEDNVMRKQYKIGIGVINNEVKEIKNVSESLV